MTKQVIQNLEELHIHSLLITASCTDKLQPMDLTVNRVAKSILKESSKSGTKNKFFSVPTHLQQPSSMVSLCLEFLQQLTVPTHLTIYLRMNEEAEFSEQD